MMKKIIPILIGAFLFSCSNAKKEETPLSVEEYRAIASKADQEAYRLWKIREKLEEEQFDIDSIYFMSGEEPIYKAKHFLVIEYSKDTTTFANHQIYR